MAYSALPPKNAGDTFDLGNYNAIKGNFEAGVPDIFTAAGDITYATGANAATRLGLGDTGNILVAAAAAPAWQTTPCCWLHKSSNQNIGAASWEALDFATADLTDYDPDDMHNPAANSTRITIPANCAGFYSFGGGVNFDCSGDNTNTWSLGLRIRVSGATTLAIDEQAYEFLRDGVDVAMTVSGGAYLTVGQYLELEAYTTVSVDAISTNYFSPVFWVFWHRTAP